MLWKAKSRGNLETWKLGLPLGLITTRQMKKVIQFFYFSYIFGNDIWFWVRTIVFFVFCCRRCRAILRLPPSVSELLLLYPWVNPCFFFKVRRSRCRALAAFPNEMDGRRGPTGDGDRMTGGVDFTCTWNFWPLGNAWAPASMCGMSTCTKNAFPCEFVLGQVSLVKRYGVLFTWLYEVIAVIK